MCTRTKRQKHRSRDMRETRLAHAYPLDKQGYLQTDGTHETNLQRSFEKVDNGRTRYRKDVTFSFRPDNGFSYVLLYQS